MIPDDILTFLRDEATVALAATRDAGNRPHVHRVSGWRAGDDGATVECFIPDLFTPDLLPSLQDNGQFALTLEQITTHKTYQLKGTFVDSRPVSDADLALTERFRQSFADIVHAGFGLPVETGRAFAIEPAVVVRFAVREIFLQTPGPGAGTRVVPAEGA